MMIIGMNKDLFKKLCINYNKEADRDLFELWNEELEEYDPIYVEETIKKIISSDKFFPTMARIMEVMKTIEPREFTEEEKTKRMEQRGVVPEWVGKEIKNQEIDEETQKEFDEFNSFIEDFRKKEENEKF